MRKLRILLAEVVGLGILIGWLMWKYPELIETIIPWVALVIAWHVTWEFVLDTAPCRSAAVRLRKRVAGMWQWLLVFLLGGAVSVAYWIGINKALAGLATLAAERKATINQTGTPTAALLAPAGFISFVGAVIDGKAQLMQENQTDTPLDDVRLQIIASVPKSADDWGTGTVLWNQDFDIGTCRAKLTTSLPITIPVGQQERVMVTIFMLTRLQSYQENMKLTKTNDKQYTAELEFQPNMPDAYTRKVNLAIAEPRRATGSPNTSQEPPIKKIPPYLRTETFIIDIPYADQGFPLAAMMTGQESSAAEAQRCIAGLFGLYAPAGTKQINEIPSLDTIDKRSDALVQSLLGCLIDDIVTAERGSRKFGISVASGSIAEYKPPIAPPRSSDYPPDKLIQTFGSYFPFGKNDGFLYLFRTRPLQVPEGSEVILGFGTMGGKYDSLNHRLFVITNKPVFTLTFGVAPINAAVGYLPGSSPQPFKVKQGVTTYSLAITMKIEVQRDAMSTSEVDDYVRWADGLWSYLRQSYDIKRPS